jgi:glutamate carboxypeptidase
MCLRHRLIGVHAVATALFAVLTISSTVLANARADTRILAAAKTCEPKARALLQQLVQIDSGTDDVAGVAAMGALKTELESLGANVERVPAATPTVGDNIVATLTGKGKGRILLIAHMDTVFPRGTAAQRPYTVVGEHGIGPGAGDDKAGIVSAVCALRVLHEISYRDYARITLILNSNEETGSVGTRDLIRATQGRATSSSTWNVGFRPTALKSAAKARPSSLSRSSVAPPIRASNREKVAMRS